MDESLKKKDSIKILHVLASAERGGTEVSTLRLVQNMDKNFINEFCFIGQRGPIVELLQNYGFKVYYLPFSNIVIFPFMFVRLSKLIKVGQYDIIQLYGLKANFLGRIAGRIAGNKHIIGALRSKYPSGIKKDWIFWLDRITFPLSLGYISNSQAAINFLVQKGYPKNKFWLIYNGIEIDKFRKCQEQVECNKIKEKYGISQYKFVITSVANLRAVKGHKYLINALHILKTRGFDFDALFVGDGPLYQKLKDLSISYNLDHSIHFLGRRKQKEVQEILSISDIFVLPSLVEGLPTSIIEAMVSKCPVVATDVGGTSEIVKDGKTGFLVPPQDTKAIADEIAILLKSGELREKMGRNGMERVEKYFTIDKMVKSYENLYKNIAKL